MSIGLAIFVKTPGLSPVKTRLAAGTGAGFAAAFHRRAAGVVADVAKAAAAASRHRPHAISTYWAVAEADPEAASHWPGLPRLQQPDGGLGVRMASIHAQLLEQHDAAVLIGADSPQLRARWLLDAASWLGHHAARCTLGPASDGGFWLFGSNRPLDGEAWSQVAYSRPDTAQRFRAAFAGAGEWSTLPELVDVDAVGDLPPLRSALHALPDPLPGQRQLADWLDAATASATALDNPRT